jgi:hypothetical protein
MGKGDASWHGALANLICHGAGGGTAHFVLTAIDMTTAFSEDHIDAEVTDGTDSIQRIRLPLQKQKLVKRRVYQLGHSIQLSWPIFLRSEGGLRDAITENL